MKKAAQSKTIWYIVVTALGVAIAALVADDSFKELIGGWVVGLYMLDKVIQAYLRTITTTPIGSEEPKKEEIAPDNKEKTAHEKNLDLLEEPSQADDDFIKEVTSGSE